MRFYLFVLLIAFSSNTFSQGSALRSWVGTDFTVLPKTHWKCNIKSQIFSSPVECDGIIYIGGTDSLLHALDIKTGTEIWRYRTKGEIISNVCIGGDRLYLNGGDGMLYALHKQTGKLVWRFSTNGEKKYDFADYFQSTPVLSNGVLYFGSGDGNIYAVGADAGVLIWSFKTGGIVHGTAAIDHDKLFVGSFDGFVYALNVSNGDLVWKFKTVGHNYFPLGEAQGSPAVFKNLVFIGARDYNIYALDQNKGFCHWNKSFTRGWGLCTNIHDSVLYIGSSDERVLIAANPETGEEFWKTKMEFLVFGNNAYTDSMLYVGTTMGKLYGMALHSGKTVWSFETESYQNNRHKYFKMDDSYRDDIYSIITSNEQFLDVECELGGIFSTPCIAHDEIIFSSTNGTVYCIGR